jgi:hypothetical protein
MLAVAVYVMVLQEVAGEAVERVRLVKQPKQVVAV